MRNVFEYLEYSFFTLFSKRFGRIVGSSIVVDILLSGISAIIFVITLQSIADRYTFGGNLDLRSTILEILILFLILLIIWCVNLWWRSILIPLRSIEWGEEKFQFRDDTQLFRKHISYYISYITWYSCILLLWIILTAIGWVGLWYMEQYSLLSAYLLIMIIGLIILQIALTFTWYNSLLKPTYWLTAFRESITQTRGRKWQVFKIVFVFSFVVGLGSGVISSMNSILPPPKFENKLDFLSNTSLSWEKWWMKIEKEHIQRVLPTIEALLPNLSVFYFLIRIEWILSFAMIQIFLMRLTIDTRNERRTFGET